MEHKLAIETLAVQWHYVMRDFILTCIPKFQAIHISLLPQPQERKETSESIHIYRDEEANPK